jgi:hypothetical protein
MIIDEFDHYFRLCLDRTLSSAEAKAYLMVVNELADVEADNDDTVMVLVAAYTMLFLQVTSQTAPLRSK